MRRLERSAKATCTSTITVPTVTSDTAFTTRSAKLHMSNSTLCAHQSALADRRGVYIEVTTRSTYDFNTPRHNPISDTIALSRTSDERPYESGRACAVTPQSDASRPRDETVSVTARRRRH